MGSKPLFAAVCMDQQMRDDEWRKAKEEAEKTSQEGKDQAETAGETE